MSIPVLIIGQSGTGKSTAIRTLLPSETFIINIIDKPLPFRGWRKKYIPFSKDTPDGNYYASDNSAHITNVLSYINEKRPDIKTIVIDDSGYVMVGDFMARAMDKGFNKFNEISLSFYSILKKIKLMREDLIIFLVMHSDLKDDGHVKPKTVGKMTDNVVNIEGMYTYCFHSMIRDEKYVFLTNSDGIHMSKSPMGLFPERYIENDLNMIVEKINNYENQDIPL